MNLAMCSTRRYHIPLSSIKFPAQTILVECGGSTFTSPDDPAIHAMGFVTAYSAQSPDEDFAEIFSTYVCSTPEEYNEILLKAGEHGRDILNAKMMIIKSYFEDNWHLDIDALRDEVQRREANLSNMNFDVLQ